MAGDGIGHNLTSTSLHIQDPNRLDEIVGGKLGKEVGDLLGLKPSDKRAASNVWRERHVAISDKTLQPIRMRALRNRLSRMGGESRQLVRNRLLVKRRDQRINDALARLARVAQEEDPMVPDAHHGIAQLGKSKHVRMRSNLQRAILQRDRKKLLSAFKKRVDDYYDDDLSLYEQNLEESQNNPSLDPDERKAKLQELDAEFVDANSEIAELAEQLTDVVDLQIARIRNAKELDPNFDDHGMLDELQDIQEALDMLLDVLAPRPDSNRISKFPTTDAFERIIETLEKVWGPSELKITQDLGSAEVLGDAAGVRSAARQREIRNDRAFIGKSEVITRSQQTTDNAGLCDRLESHGLSDEFEREAIHYKHKAVQALTKEISLGGIKSFNEMPTGDNPNTPDRIGHKMSLDRHNDRLFYHRHRDRLEFRIESGVKRAKGLAETVSKMAQNIGRKEASLKEKRKRLEELKCLPAGPPIGFEKASLPNGQVDQIDPFGLTPIDYDAGDVKSSRDSLGDLNGVKQDLPVTDHKVDIDQSKFERIVKDFDAELVDLGDDLIKILEAQIADLENSIPTSKLELSQLKDDLVETAGRIASDRARLEQLDETPQAKTVAKHFAKDKTNPPLLADVTAQFNSALNAVRRDVLEVTNNDTSAEAEAINAALSKARACAGTSSDLTLSGRGTRFSLSAAEANAVVDKWKIQVDLEKDLRKLHRAKLEVTRAKNKFRDRGLVSAWLHKLSFWAGFGGAYRPLANANDDLKSARKAAFKRFSAHVHASDDKELQEAFSNFVNHGFAASGVWVSNLSAATKTAAGGLEAVMMMSNYLEERAIEAGEAGKDAIDALLKNDGPDSGVQGGIFQEGTSEFLEKLLNGIEHVEHGAGAIASVMTVVNAQTKINEKRRKKRIGEKLISNFDNALQKKKNNLDREHYAVRHGVSRMLGWRLSDQRVGAHRFEQLTGTGQASRHVISSAARFVKPDYAAHAASAHLLGQIGIGGAAVFEAGEMVASLVEATHGKLESNKLEKKYQEKKRQFLSENKSVLGLQSKTERDLSKLSRDDIGKTVDAIEEQKRKRISTLNEKPGNHKQQIRKLRAEIEKLRKTFDDLSNLREFVTTLRERKKVNEKFFVFVKGMVATGGYSSAFAVSFGTGSAVLGPVVSAGALGVAGMGALAVKIYRSKKASNIERRAQMADKALMEMAQPGMIKEIQKKAKKHHVSAETIAWEMLMMKDPEYRAEQLLADLHQEAGHLRMTDAQIKKKALLEDCRAQHRQEEIDLAKQFEKATFSAQVAERKAGQYSLWMAKQRSTRGKNEISLRMKSLNKARDDAFKKRDELKAQLESHRRQRLTIQDPDNQDQQIDVDAELQRIDRDRGALFNKSSPNHSKTALILHDVVGMSATEILAMIDAGDTRDDEHAAELSRALIVVHLEEE